MSKLCKECGKRLSLFSSTSLCKECDKLLDDKYAGIRHNVLKNFDLKEEQTNFLINTFEKESLLDFYHEIYNILLFNKELKGNEIELLMKIKDSLNLSDEDVDFNRRIKPYIYINVIKEKNELPNFKLETFGFNIILKKNEKIHFADTAVLKEIKTKSIGYANSRSGVNFRIIKDVNYKTGAHEGSIVTKDRLIQFSRGVLVITNQRLFLNPFPGYRPVSISIDKILSFQAYQNGIEIYKEDSCDGYFFEIDNIGSVEIFGICLSFLLIGVLEN
ncbi:MAG: hypothetical protein IMZ41_00160 [Actinobacteria bacterium]|nr:hypothetical protein [Actinomycetota bacterium]